ncbi:ArsR/SmtB family transcription factor [Salisediminibacterium halotolerans]|uniref:ArsR/SmtB family transcription factor n=1 Tax=Salisediminibacterium halotolerans TaxID=517425 RepID=UPI000EB3C175|nr:metalloregulator ArsR/SmtB family transcription factor [Salisediminibacterium halotolerans]RLJ71728.1 regulatory ArsR family protein [Actinophytocola xinjiangensis]RPE86878.1 regulatory ArsR family protein [Salisediminibacterium halotolerans]TWG32941.1 regulatory ArsR family protein [Salisediminibacterium halotolerans]GEL08207.1 hypothetical protein SHA02_16230 [Salisediminibacterium halotolerans]
MGETITILNKQEAEMLLQNVYKQHAVFREDKTAETANIYKALGDPLRLEMLGMLLQRNCCKCELLDAFEGAPSTITHHLSILERAGLIKGERKGKYTIYQLQADRQQVNVWLGGISL